MTARYKHYCTSCIYLGQHEDYDLYEHAGRPTPYYVARFGDERNEDIAGTAGAIHPALRKAVRLAGELK